MYLTVLGQVLFTFLLSSGLLFMLIELKARFDKGFLYSGLLLMALAALTAIGVLIQPEQKSLTDSIYWTRIFYLGCNVVVRRGLQDALATCVEPF